MSHDPTMDELDGLHLLQPYIDGELSDEDAEAVAAQLPSHAAWRDEVARQALVRGAIAALPRPVAPQALRAKIALGLDAVQAEARTATAGASPLRAPRFAERWRGRWDAFVRGGLWVAPAGAAAVALFVAAQQGWLPAPGGSPVAPIVAEVEGAPARASAGEGLGDDELLAALAALQPQVGFPLQLAAGPNQARPGVQLVSAELDEPGDAPRAGARAGGARFLYMVHDPATGRWLGVEDHQRHADGGPLPGEPTVLDGTAYHVDASDRRVVVHFEHAGVRHSVHVRGLGGAAEDAAMAVRLAAFMRRTP